MCLLDKNKATSCAHNEKQGGLESFLWLYNLEDEVTKELVDYTEADLVVSAINLPVGAVLYRVDSEKFAHHFQTALEKPSTLNGYFPQTLNIVTMIHNKEDLAWLNSVLRAKKLGAVVADNNQQLKVLGQFSGLTSEASDLFDSGNEMGAEQGTTAVLAGAETQSPFKFFDVGTGFKDSVDYLITLETV